MSLISLNISLGESRKELIMSDEITRILNKLDVVDKRSDIWWTFNVGHTLVFFMGGLIIGEVNAWRSVAQPNPFPWSNVSLYLVFFLIGMFIMGFYVGKRWRLDRRDRTINNR